MTKIRLARFGSRHQPHYRIVVADSRARRDGRFIESLGSFNPQAGTVQLNVDRAEYWISVGAQPTNTTISLLTKGGAKHSFVVAKKPLRKKEEVKAETPAAEAAEEDSADEVAVAVDEAPTNEEAATEPETNEEAAS